MNFFSSQRETESSRVFTVQKAVNYLTLTLNVFFKTPIYVLLDSGSKTHTSVRLMRGICVSPLNFDILIEVMRCLLVFLSLRIYVLDGTHSTILNSEVLHFFLFVYSFIATLTKTGNYK